MYRYIKASKLAEFEETSHGYQKHIIDDHGDILTLDIENSSNGWDWFLKDVDGSLIADSDFTGFDSAQEALDDFEDWTIYNQ